MSTTTSKEYEEAKAKFEIACRAWRDAQFDYFNLTIGATSLEKARKAFELAEHEMDKALAMELAGSERAEN